MQPWMSGKSSLAEVRYELNLKGEAQVRQGEKTTKVFQAGNIVYIVTLCEEE